MICIYDSGLIRREYFDANTAKDRASKIPVARGQSSACQDWIVGIIRNAPSSITRVPALAWDAFGEKNGVASYRELLSRVRRYRKEDDSVDPVIGCNVLAEPFFFAREQWIRVPISWAPNIVQGKTYDSMTSEGAALWREVQQSVAHHAGVAESSVEPGETDANRSARNI